MRKNLLFKLSNLIVLSTLIFTIGCKRTEIPATPDATPTNPIGSVVNDATQVTASVSGIVLDETNAPITNAVVTSGTATTTTNSNGMFIFQNISLSKENGNVTVVKAGYFKGIRSFKTTEGKNHTVRIQLMQRTLSGTVNAAAGGTITSNGGATIIFPANAFVTSTGAAYTGTVSVYSRWIDPTAANLPFVIPGDLRGVSTTGVENILETYGMVGAELADASGNVLKIATGKTATVSFPIPASLSATAPASIVLWHFDDATARWKENGTATKTGSTYTGQVDKFSFWNCDVPNTNFINLDYTLINATTNTPLVSTSTRIKRANGSYGYGITNNAGFVSGLVPKNEALVLEVVSGCNTVIYAQNIGPFSNNISLGNVSATLPTSQYTNFVGTLVNCAGAAVSNGYILFFAAGGYGVFANSNTTGGFSFSVLNCGSNINYTVQGFDNTTSAQSTIITGIATFPNVNLSNITACGIAGGPGVYVAGVIGGTAVVWKDGQPISLTNGLTSAGATSVFVSGTDIYAAGFEGNTAKVWKNGVATNLTNSGVDNYATSVFVLGNDVYVTGVADSGTNKIAKLWKNGVGTNLSIGGASTAATSVFVVGSDVYVAGREDLGAGSIVKIWKNGIANNLGNAPVSGYISSLFVSGVDVYVAGRTGGFNGNSFFLSNNIWKNGVASNIYTLNSSNNVYYDGGLTSVFVSGTDIYASGFSTIPLNSSTANFVAKVWKNGVSTNLTNGTSDGRAQSIFVLGTDVYVGGVEANFAKLWKNGVSIPLNHAGGGSSSASSVFVK
jgi:Carboxypeptidase regulatory-like domain